MSILNFVGVFMILSVFLGLFGVVWANEGFVFMLKVLGTMALILSYAFLAVYFALMP